VRHLLAARPDREAVTPILWFQFIVATGAGLAVVAAGGVIAWALLNVAADLVQKWAKQ
jgi:hypothetical protein